MRAAGKVNGWYRGNAKWDKAGHLDRIRASHRFAFTREILLNHVEKGNAERLVGLALSQARVSIALSQGASEEEIGLDRLREVCNQRIGSQPIPWYWSNRVQIGIKS